MPSVASQVLSEQALVGPVAFSPRPLSPKLLLGEEGKFGGAGLGLSGFQVSAVAVTACRNCRYSR